MDIGIPIDIYIVRNEETWIILPYDLEKYNA